MFANRFVFTNDVYDAKVYVQFGGEIEDFYNYIVVDFGEETGILKDAKVDILAAKENSDAITFLVSSRDNAIWFKEEDPSLATIAHESFHSCAFILQDHSIEMDSSSCEEVYACMLSWVVTNIFQQKKY